METQSKAILQFLRSHPDSWLRPASQLRLLTCLILALRGEVIATEDEAGFRFRYAKPISLSA
jgi:hypothetical protein